MTRQQQKHGGGAVADLARYAERSLDRADYRRLCDAKMTDRDTLAAADDNDLLPLIGNERRKLAVLRDAVERWRRARPAVAAAALPPYQAQDKTPLSQKQRVNPEVVAILHHHG